MLTKIFHVKISDNASFPLCSCSYLFTFLLSSQLSLTYPLTFFEPPCSSNEVSVVFVDENWIWNRLVPPISMAATEKTFSALVFGETLPKPTDVRLVQVKYKAEMYEVNALGMFDRSLLIGSSSFSDSWYSHPVAGVNTPILINFIRRKKFR